MKKLVCLSPIAVLVLQLTAAAQTDRLPRTIDTSKVVQLSIPVRSRVRPVRDQGAVEGDKIISGVTLMLPLTPGQQAGLDSLMEAQRDPASPDYQRWLT